MPLLLFLIALPGLIVFTDFAGFLFTRNRVVGNILLVVAELGCLFILPYMYGGFGKNNVCCVEEVDTAAFSPKHQLTIISIIALSLVAYFYSKFRARLATPVLEVMINISILIGIVLTIFISFHTTELVYAIFGSLPVILLGILMLAKNQRLFLEQFEEHKNISKLERIALNILSAKPLVKFPVLLALCLPVLILISSLLLLFGQRPDSIVRAFTDTYKHGLSQWDYQCDNVRCGGHFLCSVAAMGHKVVVKPQRLGFRNGSNIICNRQLLLSNAFEELLQERIPFVHRFIRKEYNKIGNIVHRYYYIFHRKVLSDIIYLLMKPFEWFFLVMLYTLDRKPENRIAKQYLSTNERLQVEKHLAAHNILRRSIEHSTTSSASALPITVSIIIPEPTIYKS